METCKAKLAVCISGLSRSIIKGYESISTTAEQFHSVDYYIHTWDTEPAHYLQRLYLPARIKIEQDKLDELLGLMNVDKSLFTGTEDNKMLRCNLIRALYSAHEAISLIDDISKYDLIIRTRPDVRIDIEMPKYVGSNIVYFMKYKNIIDDNFVLGDPIIIRNFVKGLWKFIIHIVPAPDLKHGGHLVIKRYIR